MAEAPAEPGQRPGILLALSFSSLALLYSLMLIGVYISSSGQGLTCPDWPLCPNGFDLPPPKHLVENIHRLLAAITAAAIVATAVFSARARAKSRNTAILAAAIATLQIVIGIFVVSTRLTPLVVAAHLSIGVLLFALTLMTFLTSYRAWGTKRHIQ